MNPALSVLSAALAALCILQQILLAKKRFRVTALERKLRETRQELQHTDPLTGANSRRYFLNRTEQEFDRVRRYGECLSLILVEIDNLKKINTDYGDGAGDSALEAFFQTAKRITRSNDLIGRLHGGTFALLLPNTSPEHAISLAERLQEMTRELQLVSKEKVFHFTVSGGIAWFEGEEDTLLALIQRAEELMANAKGSDDHQILSAELP